MWNAGGLSKKNIYILLHLIQILSQILNAQNGNLSWNVAEKFGTALNSNYYATYDQEKHITTLTGIKVF